VTWEGKPPVHIVGLQTIRNHPVLRSGLESIREGRGRRAEKMGESLAAAGIPAASRGKTYARGPGPYQPVPICTAAPGEDRPGSGRERACFSANLVKASPVSSSTSGPLSVTP